MAIFTAVFERTLPAAVGQRFSKVIDAVNLEEATSEAVTIAEEKGYIFLEISEDFI